MKSDELKQIIRGIIREEMAREIVKMKPIIQETVTKEVAKSMGKILVEVLKEVKSSNVVRQEQVVTEEVEPTVHTTAAILKTNNPKLNSVLAETARNFKPLQKSPESSLIDLMDGGFEKIGKHETVEAGTPATKMDFLKQMVGQTAAPTTTSVLDHEEVVPDVLKGVFKRDFREVLAKSKEKNGMGASMRVGMM